jgi:predicted neutral ceramidase superfamily lipid hydrolase
LCIAINLIGLGSYIAIAGVFNVTAIALDWSYVIPIICKIFYGRFEPGPWNMGKASFYVNAWACIWTVFVTIIFILPTVRPVTANNVSWVSNIDLMHKTCLLIYPSTNPSLTTKLIHLCR